MELVMPETWAISVESIVAAAVFLAGAVMAYARIMGKLTGLTEKVEAMEERNEHADAETRAVKDEQAAQKTTVAVMAERILNMGVTLKRIDDNVTELVSGKKP